MRAGLANPDGNTGAGSAMTTQYEAVMSEEPALVRGTAWMMAAQGGRLVLQFGYFVLIARALGITNFGALAASLALVAIFVPFAAWGSGNILVMDVVRAPSSFSVAFGNALISIGLSAVIIVPLTVGLGAAFLPRVPVLAILLLALSDLVFGRVTDIAAPAFQAVRQLGAMTLVSLLVPAARCVGVIVFLVVWDTYALVDWAAVYLVGSAAAAVASVWLIHRRLGRPTFDVRSLLSRLKLGGYFAVNASASTIHGDIDKTMLGRLGTLDATGAYAAAYRAVGMAFMPVMALLAVAYPHFFRAGMSGIEGSLAYARRLLPIAAAYGLLAGVALYALAPLAPRLLGSDFQESVAALRWLAPLPLLSVLYYLPADALTGADAQGLRTVIQLGSAALTIVLNIFLIPLYSWRGAAWATLVSFTCLAIGLWIATTFLVRRESLREPLGSAP
jgi:O-antigen/teichoic acid export membrane protein